MHRELLVGGEPPERAAQGVAVGDRGRGIGDGRRGHMLGGDRLAHPFPQPVAGHVRGHPVEPRQHRPAAIAQARGAAPCRHEHVGRNVGGVVA